MASTNERKWFTLKVGLGALAIKKEKGCQPYLKRLTAFLGLNSTHGN
jgi:hypothetical protein